MKGKNSVYRHVFRTDPEGKPYTKRMLKTVHKLAPDVSFNGVSYPNGGWVDIGKGSQETPPEVAEAAANAAPPQAPPAPEDGMSSQDANKITVALMSGKSRKLQKDRDLIPFMKQMGIVIEGAADMSAKDLKLEIIQTF